MKKLEILISTMEQENFSLLEKMNIDSDAIVINQCSQNKIDTFKYKDNSIKWISLNERGIGLSRNTALMRATGDICLFSDDDMIYDSDYKELVLSAFREYPDADVMIFNIKSKDTTNKHYMNKRFKRLSIMNILRYGAPRIAIRTNSLKKLNIYFSLLYGGGAPYSAGEDSLFLVDCMKNNLKVYASPYLLGEIEDSKSTWFEGYTKKYYLDKGFWIANAFPIMKYPIGFYYAFRLKGTSNKSYLQILKLINNGIKKYKEK